MACLHPRYSSLLFLLSLISIQATAATATAGDGDRTTHLHFYMHDSVFGPNRTAVRVIQGPIPLPGLPANFSDMYVIDDSLTDGPSPTSAVVGRAQGFYMFASLKDSALLVNMNVVLTEGRKYNGSTLAILGRDPILSPVRELSVVGGSGRFRMARGYVLWKTYLFNITSGDAVLELDVYAMQVKKCSVSS